MINEFEHFMNEHHYEPPEILADGKIHRFSLNGKKNKDAWYVLFQDPTAGSFGDWVSGEKITWSNKGQAEMDPAERKAFKKAMEHARKLRDDARRHEQIEAQKRTESIWNTARAVGDDHPYLEAKNVVSHGLRIYKGALVLPLMDQGGEITSLQFISADGKKRFLKGGKKSGCFYELPGHRNTIYLAEGYATAATIHEATEGTVIVACDAGNLLHVGRVIREKHPAVPIVICADNDQFTESNPGLTKAREAAAAINAKVVFPEFKDTSGRSTDFNDLAMLQGIEAVRLQIEKVENVDGDSETASTSSTFWEDPINPFEDIDLGLPGWNREYCPGFISDFAKDEAERMGVLPSQIAGPAIAAISGLIPDERRLCMKLNDKGWMEAARLWIATVGSSGAKKTPAKQRVDRFIKRIAAERYEAFRAAFEAYELQLEDFNSLKKGDREGLKAPEPPQLARLYTQDATIEGLRDLLSDNTPNRKLLGMFDELSGWLAAFDAYRQQNRLSKDRAKWLELYEGGPQPWDRAGKVHVFVPNWSASISGCITPEALSEFFKELQGDGLLQRILLFRAENSGNGVDRAANRQAREAFESVVRALADMPAPLSQICYRLSDTAYHARIEFLQVVESANHLPGATLAFKSHLNKYPGIHGRLMLTYHLGECAYLGRDPDEIITDETAQRAALLLIEHCIPMAIHIYSKLGSGFSANSEVADIAGFILSKELAEVTSRTLMQSVRSVKNNDTEARSAMQDLEAYGWVRVTKEIRRRATRWEVNPMVHQKFKDQAEKERQERAERQDKMLAAIKTFKEAK